MTVATQTLSALRRLGIVIAIAVAFLFGLATTVYLSLRSPEVTVPEVVGKDRFQAENELQTAGLNFRIRATRPSRQIKSDTVMFQLPRPGEIVKAGQTVAVDVARSPREGEASETIASQDKTNTEKANENSNAKESSNVNENKPRRNKNANANANSNANGNRNANANRPNANVKTPANGANENSTGTRPVNSNRSPQTENGNANPANRNVNQKPPARATPPAAPTPGR